MHRAHHFTLLQLNPFELSVDKDGGFGLSNLCHSCGFDYQQRVLKKFPGAGFLSSEDGFV